MSDDNDTAEALIDATSSLNVAAEVLQAASPPVAQTADQSPEMIEYTRMRHMREAGRVIELDFPVWPKVRYGWKSPPHPQLAEIISAGNDRYTETLRHFCRFAPDLQRINFRATSPDQPSWVNDFIPAGDAISIYCYLASMNPEYYVEIGSGNSTLFARRAIRDHSLRTKIISYDPYPRAEIDAICDEVIRAPMENADLSIFERLGKNDIVFCDNSHRSFQNSDVTAFFLDVMPKLADGPLIGVHDIFLPNDYPEEWLGRWYNEQYLLACWILAGDRLKIELPLLHIILTPSVRAELEPIWGGEAFDAAVRTGGAFWFRLGPR